MWMPWASEIAADVFAFLYTGYASVSALYDVVGDARTVLRWPIGDPHPIGWLRTRLGMRSLPSRVRRDSGSGPWDGLERAMMAEHPADRADATVIPLLERSGTRLEAIAAAVLLGRPFPRSPAVP